MSMVHGMRGPHVWVKIFEYRRHGSQEVSFRLGLTFLQRQSALRRRRISCSVQRTADGDVLFIFLRPVTALRGFLNSFTRQSMECTTEFCWLGP